MIMGCCGNRKSANTEYEVTFRDGTTTRVATVQEARIVGAQDSSVDPAGQRRAYSIRVVTKQK